MNEKRVIGKVPRNDRNESESCARIPNGGWVTSYIQQNVAIIIVIVLLLLALSILLKMLFEKKKAAALPPPPISFEDLLGFA